MSAHDPQIVTRRQWGAVPLVTPAGTIATPSAELWLHHVGGQEPGAAGMRNLQHLALTGGLHDNYVDIPYSFKVDKDGTVFEARGAGHNSGATGGHNAISHAIVCDGNYEIEEPSSAMLAALANLVAWGFEQGWWPLGFTGGHRDASGNSTSCPGDHLEVHIPDVNALATRIHVGAPVPKPPPPPPVPVLEDEMFVAATAGKPTWLLGAAPSPLRLTDQADTNSFVAAGVKVVRVSAAFNDKLASVGK